MANIVKTGEGNQAAADRSVAGDNTNHVFPGTGSGTIPTLTSGDLQLIGLGAGIGSRTITGLTDDAGNTWTEIVTYLSTGGLVSAWYYISNFVSQPTAITITLSGSNNSDIYCQVFNYSGVNLATIQSTSLESPGAETSVIGPLTPTASGAMALDAASFGSNRSYVRDPNYNDTSANRRLILQDRVVTKPDATAESISLTIEGASTVVTRAMVLFDAQVAGAPQPPVQNSDIPDVDVNQGDTGSYDVAANGHFSLGTDGIGPLNYLKDETIGPAWPADIDINTAGLISWTSAVAPGQVDLRVIARDVGAALDTTSTPFNYDVQGPVGPNPTGTYPNIAISTGASYSDTTVRFEVDSAGGTGPLSYSQSPAGTAWPADISLNATTGEISVASGAQGSTSGLRVRCTDDGNGLFTDGNAFDYTVTVAAGTITTGPAKDADGNLVTGVTGCVVFVIDAVSGATLVTQSGVDQNPDGTFSITDGGITPSQATMGCFLKPDADPANRQHGSFDLDAT